jgi:hypothetical protein
MLDPWTPEAQAFIQGVQGTALATLEAIANDIIPVNLVPSVHFLDSLASYERSDALKASLNVLSGNIMVPRELQLWAALAEITGFDTSIMSDTGIGRTVIMAIPHNLDPRRISFIMYITT